MTRPEVTKSRAATAAFFLFAAALALGLALGTTPAEASLPRSADATALNVALPDADSLDGEASATILRSAVAADVDDVPLEHSPDLVPRLGFAEELCLLEPDHGQAGFAIFGRETCRCERTYARNNPLKYVDPDGKEIQYSAAYVARVRSDSAFAAAHRAWRFSPSGSEQHRRMGGDANTRYVLTVGPATFFGSRGSNFGHTYPVTSWAKKNKEGKLDAPKVEMTIDVDARRATDPQPPGTSTAAELAKTIFHEASHGLDIGSGTSTAAETERREKPLTNESDPAMVQFKLELKTTLPADEKELKK